MIASAPTLSLLAVLAAGALPASFLATAGWARLARRRGWVDLPDPRRLHRQPTPRGGGIGIAGVLAIALLVVPFSGRAEWGLWAGLALAAGAGLVDDLRPLPPPAKLLLQAAGTLPLAWAWPLFPGTLGLAAGTALAWLLALAVLNAWNFIDGSDGLAASQGLLAGVAALAIALAGPGLPAGVALPFLALAAVLAAGCAGFLPLNLPSARVFLGDVGSHAIGWAVAALLLCSQAGAGAGPALFWLPLSAVLVDTGLTLGCRLARREAVWRPHRQHLYQRAVAGGCGHGAVALGFAGWTLAAALLAVALAGASAAAAWGAVAAVYAAAVAVHVIAGRHWPLPAPQGECPA